MSCGNCAQDSPDEADRNHWRRRVSDVSDVSDGGEEAPGEGDRECFVCWEPYRGAALPLGCPQCAAVNCVHSRCCPDRICPQCNRPLKRIGTPVLVARHDPAVSVRVTILSRTLALGSYSSQHTCLSLKVKASYRDDIRRFSLDRSSVTLEVVKATLASRFGLEADEPWCVRWNVRWNARWNVGCNARRNAR